MSTATATQNRQRNEMPRNGTTPALIPPAALTNLVEYVPLGAKDSIKLSVAIIRMVFNPKTKNGHPASDQDVLKFMMLCRARQLDPFEGDAYLIGYEGQDGDQWSLITSIYAFLKRAEVSEHFEGMESGVIVQTNAGEIEDHVGDFLLDDEILLGGWATVHRSDRKFPNKKRVEFKRYSTTKSRWKDDPGGMISKVAECQALRDTFPTTLGGLYIPEEMTGHTLPPIEATLPTKRESLKSPKEQLAPQAGEIVDPPKGDGTGEPVMASAATILAIEKRAAELGKTSHAVRTAIGVKAWGELSQDAAEQWLAANASPMREPGGEG